MARKRLNLPTTAIPADDLQLIKGIGPVIARRLHAAGISSCTRLAMLSSPGELVERVPALSSTRIKREAWLEQARRIASKQRPLAKTRKNLTPQSSPLHYANFTVDLLLNADNSVKGTRIKHVQSETKQSWGGWNTVELVDFIVQQGRLNLQLPEHWRRLTPSREHVSAHKSRARPQSIPPPEPILPPTEPILLSATFSPPVIISPVEPASSPECNLSSEPSPPSPPTTSLPHSEPSASVCGVFRIGDLAAMHPGSNISGNIVFAGQTFSLRFVMNLTEVTRWSGSPLGYDVTVRAKKLGGNSRPTIVGREQGTIIPEDTISCTVEAIIASPGTYRLWVEATLMQPGRESLPPSNLPSAPISKLLQVC